MRGFLADLKTGAGLDRRRVVRYAAILLAAEIITFVFLVAGTYGLIVPLSHPATTDFASFYAAGNLVNDGTPALAYDQAAHYAAEQRATEPGIDYQYFYYPPVYLLLCAALARLPYLVAFVAFEAGTLLLCLVAARGILREQRWPGLVPVLAFPSVFWTMGLGQNSFLTAALFGAALLQIDRRPATGGALFGLLCYKPHFGLLIPIALAAGGRWRAIAGAVGAVVAVGLLSLLLFGWETWSAFLALADGSASFYQSGRIGFAGFVNPFGAIRLMGGGLPLAYAVQTLVASLAAIAVAVAWRRELSLPARAALLAAAAVVAAPVVLVYDLMIAGVAMVWLIRAGAERGFLPWEKWVLAGVFAAPLLSRNVGLAWHVPLGSVAALALFLLVLARAWREIAAQPNAGAPALPRLSRPVSP